MILQQTWSISGYSVHDCDVPSLLRFFINWTYIGDWLYDGCGFFNSLPLQYFKFTVASIYVHVENKKLSSSSFRVIRITSNCARIACNNTNIKAKL